HFLPNGDIAIAGGLESRALISVMDSSGQVKSARQFESASSSSDLFESIVVDAQGTTYVATRSASSSAPNPIPGILKIDASGTILWQKRFPMLQDPMRIAYRVGLAPNGDVFALQGTILRRLTSSGDVAWTRAFEADTLSISNPKENSKFWHQMNDLRSTA